MDERDTTAVIDRALTRGAAGASDPLERELEELALALAAEAPGADPRFGRELDERVRLGFPRDGRLDGLRGARVRAGAGAGAGAGAAARSRPGASKLGRPFEALAHGPLAALARRPALTALGSAASILVALAVAVGVLGGSDESGSLSDGSTAAVERPQSQGEATLDVAPDAGGGAEPAAGQAMSGLALGKSGDDLRALAPNAALADDRLLRSAPARRGRAGFAPGRRDRRIERSATLTLAAPADRLDRVAQQVNAVTERHRGFVLSSSLATGDEGATSGGSFELRIPASRLQAALADLAELGQVRARTQAGEDVTAAFVTAGDRLEAALAERESLLARLESATTDIEVEALRLQLDANAGEVNRLRARIRSLRVRTNYARVAVTLEAEGSGAASADRDGIGGAAQDALDSLGDSLELAIRILGVAVPLALVAGLAWLAGSAVRRRRREAALS